MSTGVFHTPGKTGGGRYRKPLRSWTSDMDERLMQGMADGMSFTQAARHMGLSPAQCSGRFKRLAERMGWQAA